MRLRWRVSNGTTLRPQTSSSGIAENPRRDRHGSCSRKSVRHLTFTSSTRIWAELHEQAFTRLGGSPKVVVLDNLREGVLAPDIYDPTINPLYADVLAHYGAVAMACRVGDPDRKGKVESAVGHAQKTPLKGLRFESLAEAQAHPRSVGGTLG